MKIQFDCYECILSQVIQLSRNAGRNDKRRHELFNIFIEHVRSAAGHSTPPEMAAYFYEIYNRETGNDDPFREIKERSTELGLKLYDDLSKTVAASPDPFITALKLAIGGNVIDYGVNPDFDLSQAEAAIKEVITLPFDREAAEDLRRRIMQADRILYILDNCGEAVLDRLLLDQFAGKVTLGVRGKPILNDITRRETAVSGLDKFPVADTGDGAPGVPLGRTSEEFISLMRNSDLIIAKGQGNFESLENSFTDAPIYFLFRAKCPVIQRYLNAEPGSLQIHGGNLR